MSLRGKSIASFREVAKQESLSKGGKITIPFGAQMDNFDFFRRLNYTSD